MPQRSVVVDHKYYVPAGTDLAQYLMREAESLVLHISHSFSDTADRCSYYRLYRSGVLASEGRTRDYRGWPEPLIYFKELLVTAWWVVRWAGRWDRYVGIDGLCALFGLLLRGSGRVGSVACWNVDFVPDQRFPQRWKDNIYRVVNRFSAMRVDEVWDLTPLMVSEKKRILGLDPARYRFHRVVPIGIWTARIRRVRFEDCDQSTLLFMGHLTEKQGVQLVFPAIPMIAKAVPDFRFKIIGGGSYESELRRLAHEQGVERFVEFCGAIEHTKEMEDQMARCAAGIAPYVQALDTFTQFGADPGKLKTYLGCGLPVLATDVPWIAKEIERRGCGRVITEDIGDITREVEKLLTDANENQACRDNAAVFASEFDYETIFEFLSSAD